MSSSVPTIELQFSIFHWFELAFSFWTWVPKCPDTAAP